MVVNNTLMKKTSLFIITLILLISACKKDKQGSSIPLVKTINDGTEVDTFIYDSQNKLIRCRARLNSYTFVYYNTDSIVVSYANQRYGLLEYNTFNQLAKYTEFLLGSGEVYGEYQYTYNGDGNLMYRYFINLSGGGAINYTKDSMYYSGNNCIAFVNIKKLGIGAGGYFFDRYTKTFLNKTNTIGAKNFAMQSMVDVGLASLKLDKVINSTMFDEQLVSQIFYEDGTLAMTFEYEFDSQDRVIKRVRKYTGLADYVERFTYY